MMWHLKHAVTQGLFQLAFGVVNLHIWRSSKFSLSSLLLSLFLCPPTPCMWVGKVLLVFNEVNLIVYRRFGAIFGGVLCLDINILLGVSCFWSVDLHVNIFVERGNGEIVGQVIHSTKIAAKNILFFFFFFFTQICYQHVQMIRKSSIINLEFIIGGQGLGLQRFIISIWGHLPKMIWQPLLIFMSAMFKISTTRSLILPLRTQNLQFEFLTLELHSTHSASLFKAQL